MSTALSEAAVAAGHAWHADHNAPDSTGLSPAPFTRANGARVSANDAYLDRARDRANLRVLAESVVERVLCRDGRVTGVAVQTPAGTETVTCGAVVVCAGALHSPAVLLRSGIGPADELRAAGVEVVTDLPAVGRNLQDHPMIWLTFPLAEQHRLASPDSLPGHCALRFSTGYDDIPGDDAEIYPLDRGPMDTSFGGFMVSVLRPRSRGAVRLAGKDPHTEPAVELGMLSDPADLARFRAVVRHAADLAGRPEFTVHDGPLSAGDDGPVAELDDAALDGWLRSHCAEYYHACGTCAMGEVVDPHGAVRGVEGLWVADSSIMPAVPSAATHLTTVVLAERIGRRLAQE